MYFSNKLYNDEEGYDILECTKLDNNILIYKEKLDENRHYIIKLKENQYAILFEKGVIYDAVSDEGVYTIKFDGKSDNLVDFEDYIIKNNNDSLCIIFFNTNTIVDNKFYIKKKYKINFSGNGKFNFKIKNPIKFLNGVFDIKTFYSREELLERIREKISKIVISVIKDNDSEYVINKELLNSTVDVFDEYGIKIVSLNIDDIEFKKI